MRYQGQAAIDFLAAEAAKEDPGESSHWRKYHSNFEFTGNGFKGLQGFGGIASPYTGLRRWAHLCLQWPFQRLGLAYPKFREVDHLAWRLTQQQCRAHDLDVLRQVLTVSFLHNNLGGRLPPKSTGCVIGDGFATMAALLLGSCTAGKIILVNLTKTLLVDLYYLKLFMGEGMFQSSVQLVTDGGRLDEGSFEAAIEQVNELKVVAIQASNHELIRNYDIDFVVNIASMQEMDPPNILGYFNDMRAIASRRQLFFYCCNREEKRLPDGTLTRFAEYPWRSHDHVLVDELCPWHLRYYSFRFPFYHPYDGAHRHRLVVM